MGDMKDGKNADEGKGEKLRNNGEKKLRRERKEKGRGKRGGGRGRQGETVNVA